MVAECDDAEELPSGIARTEISTLHATTVEKTLYIPLEMAPLIDGSNCSDLRNFW